MNWGLGLVWAITVLLAGIGCYYWGRERGINRDE